MENFMKNKNILSKEQYLTCLTEIDKLKQSKLESAKYGLLTKEEFKTYVDGINDTMRIIQKLNELVK